MFVRAPGVIAALGLLGLSSCESSSMGVSNEPQPGPPTIVDIVFAGDQSFRVTFSEPVAPVDDVDPSRFRLSVGVSYPGDPPSTRYQDPMDFLCSGSDYCVGDADVIGIEGGGGNEATIRVAAWSGVLCEVIPAWGDLPVHILLHYRQAAPPRIEDLDGEPLASIAEHWVDFDDTYYARIDGAFPFMDPLLPIPCDGPRP